MRGGKLLAEVQLSVGNKGAGLPGYTLSAAVPFVGDEVAATMQWAGGKTVLPTNVDEVQVKFVLHDARLYSFEFV